jgi:hypothetical protein
MLVASLASLGTSIAFTVLSVVVVQGVGAALQRSFTHSTSALVVAWCSVASSIVFKKVKSGAQDSQLLLQASERFPLLQRACGQGSVLKETDAPRSTNHLIEGPKSRDGLARGLLAASLFVLAHELGTAIQGTHALHERQKFVELRRERVCARPR